MKKPRKVFQYYDNTSKGEMYYKCLWLIAYTYAETVSYKKSHIMDNAVNYYSDVLLNTCGLCENRRAK